MRPELFAFESDFAGSLRCIPMAVRLKLDLCGIKLTLRQWSRLGAGAREDLLLGRCDDAADIASYRTALAERLERAGEATTPISVDSAIWRETAVVPDVVTDQARAKGASPPQLAQWQSLSELQRFALLKLARPGHENDNFLPAMQEFGLG